jgi:hypothetical protein
VRDVKALLIALAWVAVLSLSRCAWSQESGSRSGPPLELKGPHVVRLYPRTAPDLRFYADRTLTGTPGLRVDERGAFVGDRLVCAWPDGKYDVQNEANMVLGYRTRPEVGNAVYDACPDGFPVVSMWGDQGKGGAALYIEVYSRRGTVIEVRFEGKRYYLDLNTLPGDPRSPDATLKRPFSGKLEFYRREVP